jgi:hypothetical protein
MVGDHNRLSSQIRLARVEKWQMRRVGLRYRTMRRYTSLPELSKSSSPMPNPLGQLLACWRAHGLLTSECAPCFPLDASSLFTFSRGVRGSRPEQVNRLGVPPMSRDAGFATFPRAPRMNNHRLAWLHRALRPPTDFGATYRSSCSSIGSFEESASSATFR